MSKSEERELFFEHIKKIYMQNPDFAVTPDTIYSELRLFNVQDGEQTRITPDSLLNIQYQLSRKFSGTKGHIFSNGYFLAFENRGKYENDDNGIIDKLKNGIKLYIACDINNLYKIAKSLFNYILKEDIVSQSKVAKFMRNDVLVVRVSTIEEAEKVSKFVNSLGYNSSVTPNPFILNDGNTSVTWDGSLSYNETLSKLFKNYFDEMKRKGELTSADEEGLAKFIRKEIFLCKDNPLYLLNRYQNGRDIADFIQTSTIIADNLGGILTKEKIYEYQKNRNNNLSNNKIDSDDVKDKVLYVIYKLSNYYDIDYVHRMLVHYFNTNEVEIFTRRDSIRDIIIDYLSPEILKKEIIDIGTKSFYECIQLTLGKYDQDQCIYAIAKVILTGELDGLTRTYDVRNKLGLIVPKEWLGDIIKNGLADENKGVIDRFSSLSREQKKVIANQIGNIGKNELDDLTSDLLILSSYVYSNIRNNTLKLQNKKIGIK